MDSRGHLIYGGSAASKMVAKIISTNQRLFNLNKMRNPSANLQRRYGDGSFEIDDSYWRQPPAPHRWYGGVARNTQQPQQTQKYVPLTENIPSELAPRNRFDTPTVEIQQPQFIQLTPQLSIPVQNLQSQLPMAIAEPTPRENFQPEAPKLSEKVKPKSKKSNVIKDDTDYGDDRNGLYFRPQSKLIKNSKNFNKFINSPSKEAYDEYITSHNELIEELDNQKARIKKYIKTLDDETQIKRAKGQLEQVRNEYKNPKGQFERAKKMKK